MTLAQILQDLYGRLNYTGNPVPDNVTKRLIRFCNETHRDLLSEPGLDRLRDDVMPITAYANQARTGLPPNVARIYAITDRTNNFSLMPVPLKQLRLTDPGQTFTGSYPQRYAVIGQQAVWRQPATSGIWAASSSASDTTQRVFAMGTLTGGYPQNASVTGTVLTGTARVQLGTRTDWIEVTRFYVDLPCAGFISLYDAAASGNELARIAIGDTFSRMTAVEWFPIQTSDTTEYLDYQRTVRDLVDMSDEPLLPNDFHNLISIGARVKEYEMLDDTRLGSAKALYQERLGKLRDYVMNTGDQIASLRNVPLRWNRLGPNYPAQYWP